jgi:CO/xanthine dehydrogenase Mo-binding subunit
MTFSLNDRNEPPGGVGGPDVSPLAPATARRVRSLPLTPEKVKDARRHA